MLRNSNFVPVDEVDESTAAGVDKENTEHNDILDPDSTVAKKHCSSATVSNNTADDDAETEPGTDECEVQQQEAGIVAVPGNDFVADGFEKHSTESTHPDLNTTSTLLKCGSRSDLRNSAPSRTEHREHS